VDKAGIVVQVTTTPTPCRNQLSGDDDDDSNPRGSRQLEAGWPTPLLQGDRPRDPPLPRTPYDVTPNRGLQWAARPGTPTPAPRTKERIPVARTEERIPVGHTEGKTPVGRTEGKAPVPVGRMEEGIPVGRVLKEPVTDSPPPPPPTVPTPAPTAALTILPSR
jgi:hypothetical protein